MSVWWLSAQSLSALLGIYLEKGHLIDRQPRRVFSPCSSRIFVISWIIVIYIMDGTLRKSEARIT